MSILLNRTVRDVAEEINRYLGIYNVIGYFDDYKIITGIRIDESIPWEVLEPYIVEKLGSRPIEIMYAWTFMESRANTTVILIHGDSDVKEVLRFKNSLTFAILKKLKEQQNAK